MLGDQEGILNILKIPRACVLLSCICEHFPSGRPEVRALGQGGVRPNGEGNGCVDRPSPGSNHRVAPGGADSGTVHPAGHGLWKQLCPQDRVIRAQHHLLTSKMAQTFFSSFIAFPLFYIKSMSILEAGDWKFLRSFGPILPWMLQHPF